MGKLFSNRWLRRCLVLCGGALLMMGGSGRAEDPPTIKVALAQVLCIPGDRQGNLVRVHHAIQQASQRGAELVCFPETALLGWTNVDAHQRAHPIPGDDSDTVCRWAREAGIYVCLGLAEKAGDALHDSCILIDDQGQILLKHRKRNILSELMEPPYTPGKPVATVATRWGNVGMLICADTFHAPTVEAMRQKRPALLLVPYGWAQREDAWPAHARSLHDLVRRTARTLQCPVVGTNGVGGIAAGPWAGMVFGGQSIAVDAAGKALGVGRDRDTDLLLVEIPLVEPAQEDSADKSPD